MLGKDTVFSNITINSQEDFMLYMSLLMIYLNNPVWLIEL